MSDDIFLDVLNKVSSVKTEKPLSRKDRIHRNKVKRAKRRQKYLGKSGPVTYIQISNTEFYESDVWKRLRYKVLVKFGARCQCCGATRRDGVQIHVDHIKPRSLFPELSLDENNLQVLCEPCNIGKSNKDSTDWR